MLYNFWLNKQGLITILGYNYLNSSKTHFIYLNAYSSPFDFAILPPCMFFGVRNSNSSDYWLFLSNGFVDINFYFSSTNSGLFFRSV